MRTYCTGMLRSGSTWQYNVTADLLEHDESGVRSGFAGNEDRLSGWIHDGGDLIIKIHRPFDAALTDLRIGSARAVYIHRDLRDVAASLMRYEDTSLDELLSTRRLERIWSDHRIWSSVPGILIQCYEAMISDPATAVAQLATHLEVGIGDRHIEVIDRQNRIEERRSQLESWRSPLDPLLAPTRALVGRTLRRAIGRDATARLARPFGYLGGRGVDPRTQLHGDHIGTGHVGAYRELLGTAEQRILELEVARIIRA